MAISQLPPVHDGSTTGCSDDHDPGAHAGSITVGGDGASVDPFVRIAFRAGFERTAAVGA